MSKTSKRRSRRVSRGVVDRSATTDVMTQLEVAIRNPQAAAIGAVIGGLVPWLGRTLAHGEVPATWADGNRGLAMAMIGVVLGCALFSALSVYKFGKAAFGDTRKAVGFVLAIEGVMLLSHGTASTVALALLIVVNAVANGSVIALARDATRKRTEADERRKATRARNRPAPRASAPQPAPAAPRYTAPVSAPVFEVESWEDSDTTIAAPATWQTAAADQALVKAMPTWRRASLSDVADAEIVSEVRMVS